MNRATVATFAGAASVALAAAVASSTSEAKATKCPPGLQRKGACPTVTATNTASVTVTVVPAATGTPIRTPTPVPQSPTPTLRPPSTSPSPSPSPSVTATPEPTATATYTLTVTETPRATPTFTYTFTYTITPTATPTETATGTPTATATPIPPTATATVTAIPPSGDCTIPFGAASFTAPRSAAALTIANSAAERQLFTLINSRRPATAQYVWDDVLSQAATWMSLDLVKRKDPRYESWSTRQTFDQHRDSLGRDLATRLRDCGWTSSVAPGDIGENLDSEAFGSGEGDIYVYTQWQFAPSELALLTGTQYRRIGIARMYDATGTYHWHWVMVVSG